jgi:hypothetical protein
MKKFMLLLSLLCLGTLGGCTQNQRARSLGGKETIEVPRGQKIVTVSWKEKDGSLWILSRPMREGEEPETWSYKAKSSFGIFEGEVVLKESK